MACCTTLPIREYDTCVHYKDDFILLIDPKDLKLKTKNGSIVEIRIKRRGVYNGKYYDRPVFLKREGREPIRLPDSEIDRIKFNTPINA